MSEEATDRTAPSPKAMEVHVTLKDGRSCFLRDMTEDDAEEICALLPVMHTESDFLNYLPGEFQKTVEEERTFIRELKAKPCSLAIVGTMNGRIVALCGVWSPEHRRLAHHAELGISVSKAVWGKGLGRKIMEIVLDWGAKQGLRKIYLRVDARNERGIRLYGALGFAEEARLRSDLRHADGTFGDTLIMSRWYSTVHDVDDPRTG